MCVIVLDRASCRRTETTECTRQACRNTSVASWPTSTSRSSIFPGATPSPSSSTPSSYPSSSSPSSGGSWATTTATLTTTATPTTRPVSWAFRASLGPYSSPLRLRPRSATALPTPTPTVPALCRWCIYR